jgi:hypothetical protein
MSDIMADMKTKAAPKKSAKRRAPAAVRDTFTVRDMNRQPQAVLSAARKLGRVTIRSRNGGNFVVQPEQLTANKRVEDAHAFMARQEAFRKKMRGTGFVAPSKADSERITRMIAGDEP